jgi:putative transposase
MCDVLDVSTSGYYKWARNQTGRLSLNAAWKEALCQKIKKSFHESMGTYGSPRVHDDLLEWGYRISLKTVARWMSEMDISATPEEKYVTTTDSNHTLQIYPNLLKRSFTVSEPNTVWVTDITYIWTLEGWVYLATVMDLFSRKIVGWNMDIHMRKEMPKLALERAINARKPEKDFIHHSDRGSQYCSNDYIELLNENGAQISMSRKGDPYDNACIESFHATIKKDLIYRNKYKTRAEAMASIANYIIGFYNEKRKHSKLLYSTPNKFERMYGFLEQQKIS